jgi:predicted DNA-binding transcriptional regulator AlpA
MDDVKSTTAPWASYLMQTHPTSLGRVLLAELLTTFAALEWGYSPQEIAEAFSQPSDDQSRIRLEHAINLLGSTLLEGRFTGTARAFGGGAPVALDPGVWETDDFVSRFATSAINPSRPFDPEAPLTHWIFVQREDLQALFEMLCGGPAPKEARAATSTISAATGSAPMLVTIERVEGSATLEGLIRLSDLVQLVGMKKSTIYNRIEQGRFPAPVRNGPRISGWRVGEVREWLADPR